MYVLEARNVHEALPRGIELLQRYGIERSSRNGPVIMAPCPVTTVYSNPMERVVFWPQRDANPFFHLAESLWMLAGRNDISSLVRYAKQIGEYSDDGETMHGAYGHRWRHAFDLDQLDVIAARLRENPDDRRSVLQMWDAGMDLGRVGKDVPCNTMATFQINTEGQLELTMFCRSNDIIWGAYGANAVHMSILHEYMALWIGVPVGPYRQISVNYHAYLDTLNQVQMLPNIAFNDITGYGDIWDPYKQQVHLLPLDVQAIGENGEDVNLRIDTHIQRLLRLVDEDFDGRYESGDDPWPNLVYVLLRAHHLFKTLDAPLKFEMPLGLLARADQSIDWVRAATEWIQRRQTKWADAHPK